MTHAALSMESGYGGHGSGIALPSAESARSGASGRPLPGWLLRLIGTCHRRLYRLSGGRLGASVRGGPVLLLTTIGRRSGRARTWPLCYLPLGDDVVVVASAASAERHPAWFRNLRARPTVRVQLGRETHTMRARVAEGAERARLWARFTERYPVCERYQQQTRRRLPVVVLTPETPDRCAER